MKMIHMPINLIPKYGHQVLFNHLVFQMTGRSLLNNAPNTENQVNKFNIVVRTH